MRKSLPGLLLLIPSMSWAAVTATIQTDGTTCGCGYGPAYTICDSSHGTSVGWPVHSGIIPCSYPYTSVTWGDVTPPYQVTFYAGCSSPGTCGGGSGTCQSPVETVGGLTFSITNCAPVPPTYTWSGCFTNSTGYPVAATAVSSAGVNSACYDVPPGGTQCASIGPLSFPFTAGWTTSAGTCANPSAPFNIYPPTHAGTNGAAGGNNNGQTGAPGSGPGTQNPGSTWTPGSGSSTNLANSQDIQNLAGNIAAGLGGLDSDLNKFASQNHADNGVASSWLSSIAAGMYSASNSLAGLANGALSETYLSNVLWSANSTNTANYGSTLGTVTSATNAAAATVAGSAALGSDPGAFDTYSNSVSGGVPTVGAGSSSGLSFSFAGGATINCDPEAWCPGISSFIKASWTLILLAWFCYDAGHLLWEAAQTFASAQTGGVPDLSAEVLGVGGNIVGIAVAVLIPAAMIALWKLAFDYFVVGAISSYTSQMGSAIGGAFGFNADQVALYLLNETFPISLFLGLLVTRLTMHFIAAKIVMIAAAASRFLFGK